MATVEELKAQLAQAEREQYEADRAKRKAQAEAWQALVSNPDNWEWSATPTTDYADPFDSQTKVVGIRLNKRLKQDLLKAWRANGPQVFVDSYEDEGRWFGMFYFRTEENILTYTGGGHVILRTPKLCNDEEWAAIAAGKPPAKFIR